MERVTLRIGQLAVDSPIVLAPMAGVTNLAFRQLCRNIEQELTGTVSGLYICEMVTARALVERNPKALTLIAFGEEEYPRSVQLYTVDPAYTYDAVRMIADNDMADHIDLNFGCPVPKVTRKGGGSALPYKRRLYGQIVAAAVRGTEGTDIPVTVKFRMGIDDEHRTDHDAARIAAAEGAAAVTLHARTAAQRYSGHSDWSAIKELTEMNLGIPVLGNGDVFKVTDAEAMMQDTGCDGVEIGRGCLGRPWIFAQISAQLRGMPIPPEPTLGAVTGIMLRHAKLLAEYLGENRGLRDMRKHMGWYLRGFPVGGELRSSLTRVTSLREMEERLAPWRDSEELSREPDAPRGRQGSPGKVALPQGWLDDPEDTTVPHDADIENSGG